jgi:hypothetical protein
LSKGGVQVERIIDGKQAKPEGSFGHPEVKQGIAKRMQHWVESRVGSLGKVNLKAVASVNDHQEDYQKEY